MLKFYKQISRLSKVRKFSSNKIMEEESKQHNYPYSKITKLNFVNTAYNELPVEENINNQTRDVRILLNHMTFIGSWLQLL